MEWNNKIRSATVVARKIIPSYFLLYSYFLLVSSNLVAQNQDALFQNIFDTGMQQLDSRDFNTALQTFADGQYVADSVKANNWAVKFGIRRYVLYRRSGKNKLAMDLLDSLITYQKNNKTKEPYLLSATLNYQAEFFRAFGMLTEAHTAIESAWSSLWQDWPNYDSLVAEISLTRGQIAILSKQNEQAIGYFKTAIPFFKTSNNFYSLAKANLFLADSYLELEQYQASIEAFKNAARFFKSDAGERTINYASAISGIAKVASVTLDLTYAEKLALEALGILNELKIKDIRLTDAYITLSNIYLRSEKYSLAKKYLDLSLTSFQEGGMSNKLKESDIYNNLSVYYQETFNFPMALQSKKQSINLLENHKEQVPLKYAKAWLEHGYVATKLNMPKIAQHSFEKVIKLLGTEWSNTLIGTELYLAAAASVSKLATYITQDTLTYIKYKDLFLSTLNLKNLNLSALALSAYTMAGNCMLNMEDFSEAEKMFLTVKTKIPIKGNTYTLQEVHYNLGQLYLQKGQLQKAKEILQIAINPDVTIKNNTFSIKAQGLVLLIEAKIAYASSNTTRVQALQSLLEKGKQNQALIQNIEKNLKTVVNTAYLPQLFYYNQLGLFYAYYYLCKITKEQTYALEALELLQHLAYNKEYNIPNDDLNKLFDIEIALFDLSKQKNNNERAMQALNKEAQKAFKKLNFTAPSMQDLRLNVQTKIDIKKLQDQLRLEKRSLVSLFYWNKELFGFFITPQTFGFEMLANNFNQKLLLDYHHAIVARKTTSKLLNEQIAAVTYHQFPKNIQESNKISIQNFGAFQLLPWETLTDKTGNALVFKHAISSIKSIYDILNAYNETATALRVHIFNPNVSIDSLTKQYRQFYNPNLTPLQFAEKEITGIENILANSVLYKNENATKNQFYNSFGTAHIIHIATHTIAQTADGFAVRMLFNRTSGSNQSYFLYQQELQKLNTQTLKLLFLSSCNTGIGYVDVSNNVYSFSEQFYKAGAQAVINSLWELPDRASAQIVIDFYSNLRSGQTKDIALQQAKIAYLTKADKLTQKPFFWASLQLLGNPVALYNPVRTNARPLNMQSIKKGIVLTVMRYTHPILNILTKNK